MNAKRRMPYDQCNPSGPPIPKTHTDVMARLKITARTALESAMRVASTRRHS